VPREAAVRQQENELQTKCRFESIIGREEGQLMLQFTQRLLVERFPTAKRVLVDFHIDALAAKLDAFHAEPKTLFRCRFTP
jgi:hypothetical protein